MPNVTPERQAIATLLAQEQPARNGRFDPMLIETLDLEETGFTPIYLKKTAAINGIPHVGSYCVALFSLQGPRISREASDPARELVHSDDLIHRACDSGILVVGNVLQLLTPPEEVEAPINLLAAPGSIEVYPRALAA